jgi:hypothetical protein
MSIGLGRFSMLLAAVCTRACRVSCCMWWECRVSCSDTQVQGKLLGLGENSGLYRVRLTL